VSLPRTKFHQSSVWRAWPAARSASILPAPLGREGRHLTRVRLQRNVRYRASPFKMCERRFKLDGVEVDACGHDQPDGRSGKGRGRRRGTQGCASHAARPARSAGPGRCRRRRALRKLFEQAISSSARATYRLAPRVRCGDRAPSVNSSSKRLRRVGQTLALDGRISAAFDVRPISIRRGHNRAARNNAISAAPDYGAGRSVSASEIGCPAATAGLLPRCKPRPWSSAAVVSRAEGTSLSCRPSFSRSRPTARCRESLLHLP